jgi:hypothetical protein
LQACFAFAGLLLLAGGLRVAAIFQDGLKAILRAPSSHRSRDDIIDQSDPAQF